MPLVETELKQFLTGIAHGLRTAERHGAETDEPEGARYIQISETAADDFAETAERLAKRIR